MDDEKVDEWGDGKMVEWMDITNKQMKNGWMDGWMIKVDGWT